MSIALFLCVISVFIKLMIVLTSLWLFVFKAFGCYVAVCLKQIMSLLIFLN